MEADQSKQNNWDNNPTIRDLVSLGAYINRHKWKYLIICSLLFISSVYIYHIRSYYSSQITILVNSTNVAEVLWDRSNDGPIDVVSDDKGFNRINQIIFSSQMIDFLIKKFDLYKHYRIPEGQPDSYLQVVTILKSHINLNIAKTKIITVQITDRLDYNVAANMANAIGKKINDINRQITVENLSRKTEMFESLAKDLKSSSSKEFTQMDSLLKTMQRFMASSINDAGYRQLLSMHIENLQTKSEDYFKDLFESYKYRLYSMYSLQEKNLPTISVLEKALPNKESKSEYNIVIYPLLFVFSFMIPMFFAYIIMKTLPVLHYIRLKSSEIKKNS